MLSISTLIRTFYFPLLVAGWLLFANAFSAQAQLPSDAAPKMISVITTLRPIHSLVSMVMQGVAEPKLLLNGPQDPHHFHLRPSHMSLFDQADLVFYMDDGFELFVPNLKKTHDWRHFVALSEVVPPIEPQSDHHWLNPALAIEMLTLINEHLSFHFPDHANRFTQNMHHYQQRITERSRDWQTFLPPALPHATTKIMSDHDFLSPFTRYFQRPSAIIIKNFNGSLRVSDIRNIEGHTINCLFVTHGSDSTITRIAKQTGARIISVDPLGTNLPLSTELYLSILDDLAQRYSECLN